MFNPLLRMIAQHHVSAVMTSRAGHGREWRVAKLMLSISWRNEWGRPREAGRGLEDDLTSGVKRPYLEAHQVQQIITLGTLYIIWWKDNFYHPSYHQHNIHSQSASKHRVHLQVQVPLRPRVGQGAMETPLLAPTYLLSYNGSWGDFWIRWSFRCLVEGCIFHNLLLTMVVCWRTLKSVALTHSSQDKSVCYCLTATDNLNLTPDSQTAWM